MEARSEDRSQKQTDENKLYKRGRKGYSNTQVPCDVLDQWTRTGRLDGLYTLRSSLDGGYTQELPRYTNQLYTRLKHCYCWPRLSIEQTGTEKQIHATQEQMRLQYATSPW